MACSHELHLLKQLGVLPSSLFFFPSSVGSTRTCRRSDGTASKRTDEQFPSRPPDQVHAASRWDRYWGYPSQAFLSFLVRFVVSLDLPPASRAGWSESLTSTLFIIQMSCHKIKVKIARVPESSCLKSTLRTREAWEGCVIAQVEEQRLVIHKSRQILRR